MTILLISGVIALANKSHSKLTTILFCFVGNPHIQAEVQDPSKWIECSSHDCDGVDEQACAIEVDESWTENGPGGRRLKPNFSIITAYNSGCNTYYVVGGDMIAIINTSCRN